MADAQAGTPTISTHVLDTELGKPAAGIHVTLYKLGEDDRPTRLTQVLTDFFFDGGLENLHPGTLTRALEGGGFKLLLMFYAGFGTVFFVLGMMYLHAYRMRDHIGLNALESLDTKITCERLLLPLPVFPLAIALMWVGSLDKGVAAGAIGKTAVISLVIAGELAMFAYLGWAVWRVKQLKRRRDALERGMADTSRSDTGHTLPAAV